MFQVRSRVQLFAHCVNHRIQLTTIDFVHWAAIINSPVFQAGNEEQKAYTATTESRYADANENNEIINRIVTEHHRFSA